MDSILTVSKPVLFDQSTSFLYKYICGACFPSVANVKFYLNHKSSASNRMERHEFNFDITVSGQAKRSDYP